MVQLWLLVNIYLSREPIEAGNIANIQRQLTQTKDPLLVVCKGEYEDLDGRGHAAAKLYRKRTSSATISRGGDSDSIGAIFGQIGDAYYGFDAIPRRWITAIKTPGKVGELIDSFIATIERA